jgi:hypothetical protein
MKHVKPILFFFVFMSLKLESQTLFVESGVNYGSFYDFKTIEGHFDKEYKPNMGYSFNIGLSDIKIDSTFNLKFALGFEKYGGQFYASDGGMGSNTAERGNLQKQIIDLEFYPLNIRFLKHFVFSTGLEVNFKVGEKLSGTRTRWAMNSATNPDIDLNTISGFVKPLNWGINASLSYEFEIGQFLIKPSYKYFIGTSQEFNIIQSPAKSQRHVFQIGFGYSLR